MAFEPILPRVENPTIYLPGDPRVTRYWSKIKKLADLCSSLPEHQRPTGMFLSATDFKRLIDELRAQHDGPQTAYRADYLLYYDFCIINSGTDSEAEVNRLNREVPGAIDFADRILQFQPVR